MMDRKAAIRARAYAIWEAEGRPHGRDEQHWQQAVLDLEQTAQEESTAGSTEPATPASGAAAKSAPAPVKAGRRKAAGNAAEAATVAAPPARGRGGAKPSATTAAKAEKASGEPAKAARSRAAAAAPKTGSKRPS